MKKVLIKKNLTKYEFCCKVESFDFFVFSFHFSYILSPRKKVKYSYMFFFFAENYEKFFHYTLTRTNYYLPQLNDDDDDNVASSSPSGESFLFRLIFR